MSSFYFPPNGGGGVPTYANLAAFPSAVTAGNGSLAIALDTNILYESNGTTWLAIAEPGDVLSIGPFGSTPNANGLIITANALSMEPADGTHPGGVSILAQTFAGQKTFATGLTGTLTGAASLNVLTSALGTVTETTSSVLTLTGWTNATVGSPTILVKQASTSVSGYLSSTDWNTFNNKQSTTLTSAHLLVGNGSNLATDVAVSGDLTLANTGAFTIANLAVTNAKIANATIDLTTKVTGTLPTANGGTGTNQTFLSGSVIFVDGSGNFTQDNSMFFWDDTTKRLSLQGHLDTAALGIVATGSEVGIALTSTATNTALNVQNQGAQFAAQFTNSTNSATQGAAFGGAFSRGTTTVPLAVQAGDQVTTWSGQSYNGSSYGPGYNAAIAILATENQTATHNGGQIAFATTPNGSLAPVAGLIIGQNQALQLPTYTTAGVLVNDSSGNVTASAALVATKGGTSFNTYTTGDLLYASASNTLSKLTIGSSTQVLTVTGGVPVWAPAAATGVTAVSVATANGLAGTSSGGSTPALTLSTTITGILQGNGTAISAASVTTTPTATTFAGWDANKNLSANNLVPGFQSIATASGTTTFTVASPGVTAYTGTLNQTVVLPVVSTLPQAGTTYQIQNYSTGTISVQSSGANAIASIPPNSIMFFTANVLTGTTASSWNAVLSGLSLLSGGGFVQPTASTAGSTSHTGAMSANSTGTYTTPANIAYIKVRIAGGGGGGASSGTALPQAGTNGTATTFGSLSVPGGSGSPTANNNTYGGPGGGVPTTTGASVILSSVAGASGAPGTQYYAVGTEAQPSGNGGQTPFGGAGAGASGSAAGGAAQVNTGSGGAGASTGAGSTGFAGGGGGAGSYLEVLYTNPAATYSYTVGSKGTGGTAGTNGFAGGDGSAGWIEITEYYYNGAIGTATTITGKLTAANSTAPTVQTFTSSGSSGTYTTPTSPAPLYLKIKMVGGGGGGGAGGGSAGGAGGNTTFGSSLTANGASAAAGTQGGAGGTATVTTSATVIQVAAVQGGSGQGYGLNQILNSSDFAGGMGASTPFGGGGGGGGQGSNGQTAPAASGAGGGGGSGSNGVNNASGVGGGAGGYIEAIITSPSATYSYAVGSNGAGGTGGTGGIGGAGGGGQIIVEEFYQ